MSKKDFQKECKRLEELGYRQISYEPIARHAVYELNGSTKEVGGKRK